MRPNNTRALLLAAALMVCATVSASALPAASSLPSPSPAAQTQQTIKKHFTVLHMFSGSLQVRSLSDFREIHTFQYSPAIQGKMQAMFNAGGYQYGDSVVIWYRSGEDVALKIKGKPSKPK
jgi:hypothetical protein